MEIKCLQVAPLGTNCYLLIDEKTKCCAVIDPGGEGGRIARAVQACGCTLSAVLLTHGHYDHTGGVEALLQESGPAPVYLNRRDAEAEDPYMAQLFPPVAGAQSYDEGDCISVGGLRVEVLATPGHSEGSVTLHCGEAIFCGDTLFADSCGRTDFPGGSIRKMMESLRRLSRLEGTIYPGHMEPSTMERERAANPFMLQALRG